VLLLAVDFRCQLPATTADNAVIVVASTVKERSLASWFLSRNSESSAGEALSPN
jgi:hypothetical protein